MPTWNITSERLSVSIHAERWFEALGFALPHFKLSPGHLERFVCVIGHDGSVNVHDPLANVRLLVKSEEKLAVAPEIPCSYDLLASGRAEVLEHGAVRASALFERCGEIWGAHSVTGACAIALRLTRDFVAANAGAVLLRTRDGARLEFIVAFGPKAPKVIGSTIPVEHGLAGFLHDFPVGMIVRNVDGDTRFRGGTDRATGYHTHSMLAVPVRATAGPVFGCLELLNSVSGFTSDELEIAETIGTSLGAWLAGA